MVRQSVIQFSAFSDELQKIAKLSKKERRVAEGVGGGALILGGGATLADPVTRERLLGYKRVYHGTSPELAAAIKGEGLRAVMGGKGQAAVDKLVPGREVAEEAAKKHVYVSPSKTHSRVYAFSGGLRDDLKKLDLGKEFVSDLIRNPGDTLKALPKEKKVQVVKSILKNVNPLGESQRKGVLAVDLPMETWQRVQPDPLVKQLHKQKFGPLSHFVSAFLPRGVHASGRLPVDVAPKHIHGSPEFRRQLGERLKQLPEYIRWYPTRFGAGALAAAAGLGAIGTGGYLVHKAVSKEKEKGRSR